MSPYRSTSVAGSDFSESEVSLDALLEAEDAADHDETEWSPVRSTHRRYYFASPSVEDPSTDDELAEEFKMFETSYADASDDVWSADALDGPLVSLDGPAVVLPAQHSGQTVQAPSLADLLDAEDLLIVALAPVTDVAAAQYALAHETDVSTAEHDLKVLLAEALAGPVPITQAEETVLVHASGGRTVRLDLAQQAVVGYSMVSALRP